MAYFKNLITDKILKNKYAIRAQHLASCMAWQILNDYPKKNRSKQCAIYKNLRGVMLADEVGGGKTFETLAIISKALLENIEKTNSKERFRVLIIANPSIRSKWKWGEDEGIEFEDFSKKNYDPKYDLGKFIKQTNINIPSKRKLFNFFSKQTDIKSKKDWLGLERFRQGIWLTSFQGLPITKGSGKNSEFRQDRRKTDVFPKDYFDWIIVDEAHSLKSGSIDVDESLKLENSAIRKIYAVINRSKGAKVILLTATPFQNNISEFKNLLKLLENIEEKADSSTITGLILQGVDALEEELDSIQTEGISEEKLKELKNKFEKDINSLIGLVEENKIERSREIGAKNGLADFMRDVIIRNSKEFLTIEPEFAQLKENEKLQYLLYRNLVKVNKDKSQMFSTKLSQLVSSEDSFLNNFSNKKSYYTVSSLCGKNLVFEAKFNKLKKVIENINLTNDKTVITIFVSWIPTVDVIKKRFEKSGYKGHVYTLTGAVKTEDRKDTLSKISKANTENIHKHKIILIASRVGNEGLDFDEFTNRVIHYDNNFNPAIIDQRNGRVYRGSNIKTNKRKVGPNDIKIYQLFLEETYDQRILFIEQEKRKFKNFYLGDGSLQKVMQKTIEKNNLKQEDRILKILDSIKIDLTPHKRYLLKKYRKEIE